MTHLELKIYTTLGYIVKINLLHPGRKGLRLNLLESLEIRRGLKTGKIVTNDQFHSS